MTIMSHTQQPEAFAAYANYNGGGMGNRSPTSTRTGYATLPTTMGASRQAQRQPPQMDQRAQPIYPMHDAYGILNTISSRAPAVSTMPAEYMTDNQSAWAYNGTSATVSGPVPDMRGPRSATRRPGIPDVSFDRSQTQFLLSKSNSFTNSNIKRPRANTNPFDDQQYWMQQPDPSTQAPMALQQPQPPQQAYPTIPYGHMVNSMDQLRSQQAMFQPQHDKKDDLIPTAIVIKNIPFNVRKEVLQAVMMEMGLPQPYAFNYHFDQGVFRGLAFANFSSADETRQVIERMNQLEVHGRKLRVEYKKMLPEHERERIEREKRQKRGQLEEQHRPVPLAHQGSIQSLVAAQPIEVTPSRTSPSNMPDLNDGATLDLYVQLRKYKEDASAREYLPFESSKSPEERRLIHTLAHHLGLYHESMGHNENRCTVVWKEGMTPPSVAMNSGPVSIVEQLQYPGQNKILARAATIDFGEQRTASQNGYGTIGRNGNPSLEIPEDGGADGLNNATNLRTIRSMAELGRPAIGARTPSPGESIYANSSSLRINDMGMSSRQDLSSAFQGMSTTPTTPGGSSINNRASDLSLSAVTNNLSSLSVAEVPYETSRRENPGAIGSQRPSMNGLNGRNAPERQPRGPENGWESSGGFAIRRANGHAQRGSGSSSLHTSESYNELLTGSAADSSDNFHSGGSNGLYSH